MHRPHGKGRRRWCNHARFCGAKCVSGAVVVRSGSATPREVIVALAGCTVVVRSLQRCPRVARMARASCFARALSCVVHHGAQQQRRGRCRHRVCTDTTTRSLTSRLLPTNEENEMPSLPCSPPSPHPPPPRKHNYIKKNKKSGTCQNSLPSSVALSLPARVRLPLAAAKSGEEPVAAAARH